VVFTVEEWLAVFGNAVADLTHLVAELVENAVHFSPPEASVVIRTRPFLQTPGAHVLTVEDWGVGMPVDQLNAANDLLTAPGDVDLSVSQRLGLHVVARLAQRHGIEVSLTPTPGCGVTAAVVLPPSLFSDPDAGPDELPGDGAEVPAGVVPAVLAASTVAPPADLPAAPPSWAPAERWIDLTDGPAGNGHGPRHGGDAERQGRHGADWSDWWEPYPGDPEGGEPVSPIAARPPLSERARAWANGDRSGTGGDNPASVGEEGLLLSRRIPQAHLAPELRRSGRAATTAAPGGPLPDAAEARAALSRYQASRQAARALVDEGGEAQAGRADDLRPEPPSSAGGWP
jgi:hypothetical protein